MKYIFKYLIVFLIFFVSVLLYLSSSSVNWSYKFYVITSNSMSPALKRGDLVIIGQDKFSTGDVVTFKSPIQRGEYITHRIVKENFEDEFFFTTKGDANPAEDPWRITSDMIVGKQKASIPFIGHAILYMKSSQLYLFILGGGILLFIFGEINFLSSEVVYEWQIRSRYRIYRKLKRFMDRIDRFFARFNQHKLEDTGF